MRATIDLIEQGGYSGLVARGSGDPMYFTSANFHRDLTDLNAWATANVVNLDFGSSVQRYLDNPYPNTIFKSVFGEDKDKAAIAIGTYMVAMVFIEKVQKEIAALNRKAAKIGASMIHMIEGRPYVHTYKHIDPMMIYPPEERHIEVVDVTILGETPVINGWQFIATIQHGVTEDKEEGHAHVNVIAAIPGLSVTVPAEYWTIEPICQHCGYKRRRNDTYLLRNIESGEWKQVGSGCLKDFTGANNPQAIAKAAEWWAALEEKMGGYREGGSAPILYPINLYLAFVLISVKTGGWVSRGKADEYGKLATADDALYTMQDYAKARKDNPAVRAISPEMLSALKPEVETMLAWLQTQHRNMPLAAFIQQYPGEWVALSEYMRNLLTACVGEFIKPKHIGLVASLVPAYRKALDMIRERATRPTSHHVGQVGEKITVKVQCVLSRPVETQYGVSTLHKFVDEQGNQFTWFASRDTLDDGKWYIISGTVKNHEVYRNEEQTMLTRCKYEVVGGDEPTPPPPVSAPEQMKLDLDTTSDPIPAEQSQQPRDLTWYYASIAELLESRYDENTISGDMVYQPHNSHMIATREEVVAWTKSVADDKTSIQDIENTLASVGADRQMDRVFVWWLDQAETKRILIVEDVGNEGWYRTPIGIENVILKQMVLGGAMPVHASESNQ